MTITITVSDDEISSEIQRELEMDRENQFILQQMIEECEEEEDGVL
jgi:hypothetical protein